MPPSTVPEPCVLVIFGASGDLTARKLVPALYELDQRRQLPDGLCVLGVSRTEMTDDAFRDRMREAVSKHAHAFDADRYSAFARRLHYFAGDAVRPEAYPALVRRIEALGAERGIARSQGGPNVLFYLSVAPELYEPIVANVGASGLVTEGKRWCVIDPAATAWQRIVVEKPFGTDLTTARSLNRALGRVFEEDAVYRIDHYLGKELVQNLLVMRFANSIFEPIWNRDAVHSVQMTASETIGVGARAGSFYDGAGAIRDMIQSHLLQVLALVAMEPPPRYEADAIVREKIKLFSAARIAGSPEEAASRGVLGRYGAGPDGPAYADEAGVDPDRRTETFAAMRVEFDNWRWAGVPFFVRTGKRLAAKLTEVVVQFREPPTAIFRGVRGLGDGCAPNRLVINVAPREGISLELRGKVPGAGLRIASAALDLDYVERFGGEPIEAYGPLLLDAMRGDRTLFKHRDEVEGGWSIVQPYLDPGPLRERIATYAPGSWGPREADTLIESSGCKWHNTAG